VILGEGTPRSLDIAESCREGIIQTPHQLQQVQKPQESQDPTFGVPNQPESLMSVHSLPKDAGGASHNGVPIDSADMLPDLDGGYLLPNHSNGRLGGLIDFALETNLDLSIADLNFLESYNAQIRFEEHIPSTSMNYTEDGRNDKEDRSVQRLRWRYVPVSQDHGYSEHDNLHLANQAVTYPLPQSLPGLSAKEGVDLALRDKILTIMLSQMSQPLSRAITSFPSPELLDRLIRYYLTMPASNDGVWIHLGTFNVKRARPELLIAMAAAGAVLTPDSALQKLGFAMQEVVRHHLPTVFEADNSLIRDLELHQTYLLYLEISLWSGNSRKIEISESFRQPLVNMLRRGGMFHTAAYPPISVDSADTGQVLEDKWRAWARQESVKKLVYHLWQHDMQSSMALQTGPLVSYAEIMIPLPASSALWLAKDAVQWKGLYLKWQAECSSVSRLPSIQDCLVNMDYLHRHRHLVEMSVSCAAVLHALWGMIWEYRQMNVLVCRSSSNGSSGSPATLTPSHYWHNGLLMISRYQQLEEMLNYFAIGYREESTLLRHSIQMHMHMSLEDIQLFAAALDKPVTPAQISHSVRTWFRSKDGRWAVWHAGQVVRELKTFPQQYLRDFTAIALYHSALTLWAYSMGMRTEMGRDTTQLSTIWLDGPETEDLPQFITLERSRPFLEGRSSEVGAVDMRDPSAVLALFLELMRQNHSGPNASEPPLIVNLVSLIERLREVST
jgi:hypothetical protein